VAQLPPAGWHPDPHGVAALRWWDGSTWTDHVHPPPTSVVQQVADAMVDAWQTTFEQDWEPTQAARRRWRHLDMERPALAVALRALVDARDTGETIVLVTHGARVLGRTSEDELAVTAAALTDRGGIVVRLQAGLPGGPIGAPEVLREPPERAALAKRSRLTPHRGPLLLRWSEDDGFTIAVDADADRQRAEAFLASRSAEPLDPHAAALRGA